MKMTLPVIFIVLGMILLCIFLAKRAEKSTAGIAVLKSFVSACFLATALTSVIACIYRQGDAVFGLIILCGLFFGAVGDIWLDLKYVHPEADAVYSFAGFSVFGIGHILYDIALISRYYVPGNAGLLIGAFAIPAVVGILMPFSEDLMKVKYGKMKAITSVYTVLLISLISVSAGLAIMNGFKNVTLIMVNIGAVLFAISDGILCQTYFGQGKNRPVDKVVNHLTYYLAQFIIAFAVFFHE